MASGLGSAPSRQFWAPSRTPPGKMQQAPIRQGSVRWRSGTPVALRDDRWSRSSCEIRRSARLLSPENSSAAACRSGRSGGARSAEDVRSRGCGFIASSGTGVMCPQPGLRLRPARRAGARARTSPVSAGRAGRRSPRGLGDETRLPTDPGFVPRWAGCNQQPVTVGGDLHVGQGVAVATTRRGSQPAANYRVSSQTPPALPAP